MSAPLDPRTPEGVAHIARLSRLALAPEELSAMAAHLGKILDAVSVLERLDTQGVPAGLHDEALSEDALRADAVAPSLPVDEALRNAPARGVGGFEVPAVLAE
ncbi:MAG: Asp-tRNA(Asn)/Glu-tRNA(Gln) amidotransferase subunit GatC [Planctomycetes bacterium]|nr:Asp-tRNA(Asn)/Glu-tRNA(Gln) amidotransferase subunit GatC [Planctomycetota bacterium]